MQEIVEEFFLISGINVETPLTMGEFIPYLMQIFVGVAMVSGVFNILGKILDVLLNTNRWIK